MNIPQNNFNFTTRLNYTIKEYLISIREYLNRKPIDNATRLIFNYSLFILIYVGFAKLGLEFGTFNNDVTIYWPPSGIALAFVVFGGRKYIPAVFLSALFKGYIENAPIIFLFGAAAANTLETACGYYLLTHIIKFNWRFDGVTEYLKFILFGAFIPSLTSAVIGSWSLYINSPISDINLLQTMFIWWAADVLGIVYFAVLVFYIFNLLQTHTFTTSGFKPLQVTEVICSWIASIFLGLVVLLNIDIFNFNLPFEPEATWLFIVIVWSGLRCGKLNTMLIQGAFLLMALWSAKFNIGYFSTPTHFEAFANFWALSMLFVVGGCLISIQLEIDQRVSEKAKHQANHDYLTGLPTRLLFTDRFEQNKIQADKNEISFPILFIDLDNFKPINDKYGHIVGDKLLIEVGKRLKESVRHTDTVARIGGDEFLILIPDLSEIRDILLITEKVRQVLNEPFAIKGKVIQISASIGVSIYPHQGTSLEELIKAADSSMYVVKKQGGNNFSGLTILNNVTSQ